MKATEFGTFFDEELSDLDRGADMRAYGYSVSCLYSFG
jgi:hypothetical protein